MERAGAMRQTVVPAEVGIKLLSIYETEAFNTKYKTVSFPKVRRDEGGE